MKKAILIFPHQLFEKNPLLKEKSRIYLIEHPYFFSSFAFHKKKLLLHRASMQYYKNYLTKKGHSVAYVEHGLSKHLFKRIKKDGIHILSALDPIHHELEKDIIKDAKKNNVQLELYQTPYFMTSDEQIAEYFEDKTQYRLYNFYTTQRKRFDILISKNGTPKGGSWSFDDKNRKKLPNDLSIQPIKPSRKNEYTKKAEKYVQKKFSKNPGQINDFFYPTTHRQAKTWLSHFLENRLKNFGPYQDAITQEKPFIFHSLLSSSLNIGLLTPSYVIQETLKHSKQHKIPLNSLEGFIRQIIGWREFIWGTYMFIGKKQKQSNFWNHKRKIPKSFYDGTTGIEPVDDAIKKTIKYAYAHHIERLMVLGNFMMLCEFDPKEVYRWFMELFIDSYEWVMVPNVFGMSQYADGGLITTKPYLSSSNYILKMSDYKKGEWCTIWDALYWHFIDKHKKVFSKEPRLKMMVSILQRMKKQKVKEHLTTAKTYLKNL